MRSQFIGYVRAVRGERLLGNRIIIESDPDTRKVAEAWVAGMLASNVEAGKQVAEAGTRKYEPKTKKRTARKTGKIASKSGQGAENETETEAETATAQPGRRARARSAHRQADDPASARKNAK